MKCLLIVGLVIAVRSERAIAAPTAEVLYDQGQRAYDAGDYASAIIDWERSYFLSDEAALLFNLAQANRLFGDCTRALWYYKHFLARDPGSEQRALANDFVHELEPTCVAPSTPMPVSTTPPDDHSTPRRSRTLKLAGLVTGGAGVGLIVAGLSIGHHGSTLGDAVTRACAISCDWATQKDRDAAGRRYAAIGDVFDVVGIAALVSGAALYYFGARDGAISIAPRAREGGGVVSWSESW